jgi:hypothetical protein
LQVKVTRALSLENLRHWHVAARARSIKTFFGVVEEGFTPHEYMIVEVFDQFTMAPVWTTDYAFKSSALQGGTVKRAADVILHYDTARYEFALNANVGEDEVMRMIELGAVVECHALLGVVYDYAEGIDAETALNAVRAAKRLAGPVVDPGNYASAFEAATHQLGQDLAKSLNQNIGKALTQATHNDVVTAIRQSVLHTPSKRYKL